jgi:gluconolactonase
MSAALVRGSGLEALTGPEPELETLATGFVFTEGPAWSSAEKALYFSDIQDDARWRWSPEEGARLVMRPNFIGNGMVYDRDGGLLVCEHVTSSVVRIRRDGARELVAFHYGGKYLNSPNDVITASDGSIWFTDPDYGRWDHRVGVARRRELGFRGLYRVPPGGGPAELMADEDEFEQPNGLCLSPDESVLYVDDLRGIKAFAIRPDGTLGPARILRWNMGDDGSGVPGEPDGMKCDELGNVWCAARGGIWVISPQGELLGVLETPEVTANLAWGGPEWRTLYLCTSTTLHRLQTKVASAPLPYHRA